MVYTIITFVALFGAVAALCRSLIDHINTVERLQDLEVRAAMLEKLLKERGDLANELAHEIKNPITAILCSAEALDLLVGPKLETSHRKCLQYIREYGDNLLHLVSDFLDLSRAETGHIHSQPEVIAVKGVAESVIGLLQSSAIKKHITLRYASVDEDIEAMADPKHLKQVLFNLVHNAIKFAPEKGEVIVNVASEFPHSNLRISVTDNGQGIPTERLENIFDPYVHYESQDSSTPQGAGLGLAVCRALVELQGGAISAKSEPGVGTCFEFTLPEHKAPWCELAESGDYDPESKPLSGQSILLVNQDPGSREAMAQLIEAWGGMVDQVTEAAVALKAISEKSYDTVMVDDALSGMTSEEFARAIQEDAKAKETKLIVAAKNKEAGELALSSGADLCVSKPISGRSLLGSLLDNNIKQ